MKKVSFSSRPETKFSGLWNPGTFRAQPCGVVQGSFSLHFQFIHNRR